ncbi:hypothetical protein ACFP6B_02605 [Rothia nasimurium]|uniref:hypothetical protein n=1 Tax=Rothia nasimurium TaxID=85336 RepID=UPI003612C30A
MTTPKPGPFIGASGAVYHYSKTADYKKAAQSRCCRPLSDAFLEWHTYWHLAHEGVTELVLWLKTLPTIAQERVLGQLEALYDDAAAGLLDPKDPGEPIKAIDQGHDFYELRQIFNDFGTATKLFRQYHAEPSIGDVDNLLITSHVHFKQIDNLTAKEIAHLQTQHMQQAVTRFSLGKPSHWGLKIVEKKPLNSLHLLDLIEQLVFDSDSPGVK